MDVMEAVLTRRSAIRLDDPAPDDDELLELIQAASTAPDHGLIRPWRLVTLRGEERDCLGQALSRAADDPVQAERALSKPLRAPLLVSLVFCPRPDHPKVPEWEQLAATAAMAHTLQLLLHSRGWGAIWRTGDALGSPWVRECIGADAAERLLGWLYVGTPNASVPAPPRRPFDASTKMGPLGLPRHAAGHGTSLQGTGAKR